MKSRLVSTRNINVVLAKQNRLERVTTKTVNVSIKKKEPKEDSMNKPLISTHNIGDVVSTEEKKERDTVRAERKNLKKDGPVYLNKDGVLVASDEEQKHVEKFMKDIDGKVFKTTEDLNLEMRDEKKIAMAERMAKARDAKGKKKEE